MNIAPKIVPVLGIKPNQSRYETVGVARVARTITRTMVTITRAIPVIVGRLFAESFRFSISFPDPIAHPVAAAVLGVMIYRVS